MRLRIAYLAAMGFCLFSAAFVAPAAAQSSDDALARQLFEQGVALSDEGNWEAAADRYRRSLELRPSPIVAYNLGSALIELGSLVEASEAFRRAARASNDEVRSAARAALEELEPRIATLTLHLDGPTDGVTVLVGDRRLPTQAIGVDAPVNPGPRRVSAIRDSEEVAGEDIDLEEGGRVELTLTIPERAEPPPDEGQSDGTDVLAPPTGAAEDEDDGGSFFASPWLWVTVGVLLVGGGVLAGVLIATSEPEREVVMGTLQPAVVEF